MHHRRAHKKSKNGCQVCRERKIKCDEARPRCTNCLGFQVRCSFDLGHSETARPSSLEPSPAMVPARRGRGRGRPRKDWSARTQRLERPNSRAKVTAPSPQVDAIPSASPSTPAPSTCCTTCSLNVDDIELILHFTTQTAHTLAHPDPPNNLIALFWSQNTPRLGLSCHAVLHLILGLAGYHLAYLTADPRTDPDLQPRARYASLARKHGALGLAELTRTLGNIDESNCGALYTAAVLVSFCTFAAGPTDANDLLACNVGEENANNEARLHPWMSVVQGVRLIAESFEPDVLFSGLVAPLRYRPRPDFEMSSSSRANLPTCIERGLPRINWQGPMDRLRALIVTRGESHVAEVYLENFQRIRSIYEATYGNVDGSVGCESENKFIFIWLYTIEDSFVACVRQKEPLSLLILAYYAVLLTTMKRDWYIQSWPGHLLMRIRDLLGQEYGEYLEWPLAMLGLL